MNNIESRISFVEYTKIFLEKSYKWLNDLEIKYLTDTPDFTKEAQQEWFETLSNRNDYKVWGIEFDKKPIGVVGLKHINNQESTAEYFGYIGEKEYWGHGIRKLMIQFCIKQAKLMKINNLTLNVIKDNIRAINLYRRFGFETFEDNTTLKMNLFLFL